MAINSVESMLVPSAARIPTSNSDWSSFGRKFLFANMNSGTLLSRIRNAPAATVNRCPSAQVSTCL